MSIRDITPAMSSHLQQTVTTVAVCVSIRPKKFLQNVYLTEHDRDLVYNGIRYKAGNIKISNIQLSNSFSNDNCELTLPYDKLNDNVDILLREYLDADVDVFLLNHQDTSTTMGKVSLFKGYVSSTEITDDTSKSELKLTVLSVLAKLAKEKLPSYSKTCRTSFGSSRCMFPALPVNKLDTFLGYPRTYEVGYQGYTVPAKTQVPITFANWIPDALSGSWTLTDPVLSYAASNTSDGVISNSIDVSSVTDGDLLFFDFETSNTSGSYSLRFDFYDNSGKFLFGTNVDVIEVYNHNYTLVKVVNSFTVKVTITVNAGTSLVMNYLNLYTFATSALSNTREKLTRVTYKAIKDRLPVPNGTFYKDGGIASTCDLSQLSDWTGTCGTYYFVDGSTNYFHGLNVTIEQTLQLPVMGCDVIKDGCYWVDLYMPHTGGTLTSTVTLLDSSNAVIQTVSSTGQSLRFRITPNTNLQYIKISFACDAVTEVVLNEVDLYILNGYISAVADPTTVLLNTSSDKDNSNDLWLTDTAVVWYETTVSAVTANFEKSVITITTTGIPSTFPVEAIHFLTGNNSGFTFDIKAFDYTTGLMELTLPAYYNINVGDRILLKQFCDKTINTCALTFNNAANFRGEPFLPTQNQLDFFVDQS